MNRYQDPTHTAIKPTPNADSIIKYIDSKVSDKQQHTELKFAISAYSHLMPIKQHLRLSEYAELIAEQYDVTEGRNEYIYHLLIYMSPAICPIMKLSDGSIIQI